MMNVIPWSWSLLEAYNQCPKACYEKRIAKNYKEDFNTPHIVWGNSVHKALENRVASNVALPSNMKAWEPMAERFASMRRQGVKVYCELEVGVTSAFEPTGYWDDNCWHRGKDDLVIVNGNKALSTDYKTGAVKNNTRQLELSAARLFVRFPEVEEVNTAYAWLSTTQKTQWTRAKYVRADAANIWENFIEQVKNMEWSMKNNTWPAKPSGLCKRSNKPGSTYGGCIVANCPHSEYYKRGT